MKNKLAFVVVLACLGAIAVWSSPIASWTSSGAHRPRLVVYCAHDGVFAEAIIRRFEEQAGIKVVLKLDSEATKSLGLVNQIISEKASPRCDVFWNNQTLTTEELREAGCLEPCMGPGFARIPNQFKDAAGYWTGFAGRFRVVIVNTRALTPDEETIAIREAGPDLSRMVIAKPLYGTTLTHFAVLANEWGLPRLKDWFRTATATRKLRIANGNGGSAALVGKAVCDLGWTDTDDAFLLQDQGQPVAMAPIRVGGKTICIPNSVCLIKGTRNRAAAEQLIEFLLSEEAEILQANSTSRQVPLGPVDETRLPAEVRRMLPWVQDAYDLKSTVRAHSECLEWLRQESLQ